MKMDATSHALDRALAAWLRVETLAVDDATAAQVLELAREEQLEALAARAIGRPSPALERRALHVALAIERDLREVEARLVAHGVEHAFLKGAIADPLLWRGRGLRGTTDLDVLVARSDEAGATEALRAAGYERHRYPRHLATNDATKERLFSHREGRRFPVDLHVGLVNPPYVDLAADVLRRAVTHETAIGPIRGLSLEDMVVHAIANLGGEVFRSPRKLLLDVARLLERPLDYDAISARLHDMDADGPLWLARRRLEAWACAVPEGLRPRQPPSGPRRALIDRTMAMPPERFQRFAGGHGFDALARIVFLEWPLSGRPLWPIVAVGRWSWLRVLDRVRRQSAPA